MQPINNQEYSTFLHDIKQKIQNAQSKAIVAVNTELVKLYWIIGKEILKQQQKRGWGGKVIDQLSKDIKKSFPGLKGYSKRNLLYMKQFAEQYPDLEFTQAALAQISWYHNVTLIEKCKSKEQRDWYAQNALKNGWSRNTMLSYIESDLYSRQGSAINNFEKVLPSKESDLIQQELKDPYIFDFLNLTEKAQERDIENALIENITQFLLELGKGFAFVGRQYSIIVGNKEFFIDLLFYHIELECYVVIELKAKEFKPEYAGQLGFYLTAIDKQVKKAHHKPTIGLIICREKNELIAEYSLGHINNPVGISEYKLSSDLESKIKKTLPSIEEIEEGLNNL